MRNFKVRSEEGGFTLAELLIVVAIIGVLVAISIPVFTNQLEKAKEAVDIANVRAAYSEVVTAAMMDDRDAVYTGTGMPIYNNGRYEVEVPLMQEKEGWTTSAEKQTIGNVSHEDDEWINDPKERGTCTVYYESSTTYIDWDGEAKVISGEKNSYWDNNDTSAFSVGRYVYSEMLGIVTSEEIHDQFNSVFTSKTDTAQQAVMDLPNGEKVNVYVYNRNYDSFKDVITRCSAIDGTCGTASLIYNRTTGQLSTIIYYDKETKVYSAWTYSEENANWQAETTWTGTYQRNTD